MSRVRLTDQALVAVALGRASAAARGSAPTLADLLVGLAAEPEGIAGPLLRASGSAAARLQERSLAPPPRLASLDAALVRAAAEAAPRPPGTRDLLLAALAVGGEELADLLVACGYEPSGLVAAAVVGGGQPADAAVTGETLGLPPADRPHPTLSPAAARVVAGVRAAAGGAVALVQALLAAGDDAPLPPGAADNVTVALWNLRKRGEVGGQDWDRGLEVVLEIAERWREGALVSTRDLLRAAVLAGGRGPAALLHEVERLA